MADDPIPSPTSAPTGSPENLVGRPEANGHTRPTEQMSHGTAAAPAATPRRSLWRHLWGSSSVQQTGGGVQHPTDNTREIVETIVFVVVLVLMLKSFAAEAFVIPTGSMAETLWGYQKVVTCPECKFQFPVNSSQEADPQEGRRLTPVVGCICPNCLKPIRFSGDTSLQDEFKHQHPDCVDVPDPSWTSGDRVLVAKFLYEMFNALPNRLDVVVFKFPGDEGPGSPWPQSGPQKNQVPINYIKRLVGEPGEMIAIKGGKLYVLPPEKVRDLPTNLDDLAGLSGAEREEMRLQLWRKEHMHVDDPEAKKAFNDGKFSIVKKPPEVLLSMRRIVYDNDHQAADQTKSKVRWPASDSWAAGGENGFVFKAEDKDFHWLRYRHVLRGDNDKRQLISDVMGYNTNFPSQSGHFGPNNWVGDLVLECEAIVDKAEGELVLELSRSTDRFRAVWDLSNGRCTLYRQGGDGKEVKLDSAETKLKKGTYQVRFANVDRRLTLWVDKSVVEWSGGNRGVDYEAPMADLPTDNDLEPASIGAAKGAAVRVQKLKLWRDTYYTVDASSADLSLADQDWSDPSAWANKTMPYKTLYVQPGHFLCMGDNSPQSSDGRNWGLVPERLMLGRAQLVYYPFYFPWPPLWSQVNRVGLIR